MTGEKHDTGKPRTGLMISDFSRALRAVAEVSTYGAEKYSPSGWLKVPDAPERYLDALYRHLLADCTEELDGESGLMHLAHAAWNLLALLEIHCRLDAACMAMTGNGCKRNEEKPK